MKTLEALYNQILKDEALKADFAKAVQEGDLSGFLKKQGCEATKEEVLAFLKEKQKEEGKVSDDELSAVSGGCNQGEAMWSGITLGIGCAGVAIDSAINGGTKGDNGKILCGKNDWNYDRPV